MKLRLVLCLLLALITSSNFAQPGKPKTTTTQKKPAQQKSSSQGFVPDRRIFGTWEATAQSSNPAIGTTTDRMMFQSYGEGYWSQKFSAPSQDGKCTLNYLTQCDFLWKTRNDTLFIEYKKPTVLVNTVSGNSCEAYRETQENLYSTAMLKLAYQKMKSKYSLVNSQLEYEGNKFTKQE